MERINCDIIIVGAGMVGLSIANQLIEKNVTRNIVILEKENDVGLHSSGRNSGVLHAGIYYKPESLRAKICVEGAQRLKNWVVERDLELNNCGKIIVPQREDLDQQLDVLFHRGKSNGALIELIDENQLKSFIPQARTATGRALWSPNTCVVKPISIIHALKQELLDKGVVIIFNQHEWVVNNRISEIKLSNNDIISYGHLINCAGLHADKVAHKFEVGLNYMLLPFKGSYWQIKKECTIKPKCNLYPVPDLNIPFLGVHFTPSADSAPTITIGPTATPALGRENYKGTNLVEPLMLIKNLALLSKLYVTNQSGFRRYVHEQAFLNFSPLLIRSAQELIPSITLNDIQPSKKVGIRSQLFNQNTNCLEDDFICLEGFKSTHILNAISPAFTASFALADLILRQSNLIP